MALRYKSRREFQDGIRTDLAKYAEGHHNRRDLAHYAEYAQERAKPRQRAKLPAAARKALGQLTSIVEPQQGSCYANVQQALGLGGLEYWEGIYWDSSVGGPIQHAWLEFQGAVVDPTFLAFHRPYPHEDATYWGVTFPWDTVHRILVREEWTRAIALGGPRLKRIIAVEDIHYSGKLMMDYLSKQGLGKRRK